MSSKDCGHHGHKRRKLFRRIFAGILIFLLIVLIIVLLVWAILRPTKPKFVLQDVTVYTFNATVPNFLTTILQVTVSSRNPNDQIAVYYNKMDIYATYHGQQVTLRTTLPPTYQDHKEVNVWSPFVQGNAVPIAPFYSVAMAQDQSAGAVQLVIKIDGRVKFKVGSFTSGGYHLYVTCPALIQFGNRGSGVVVGDNAVKYMVVRSCSVSV